MSIRIWSVSFDCADPGKQAEFWAAALGTEVMHVEERDNRISLGGDVVTATEEYSSVKTGIPGLRLEFGKVPEGKVVKNRAHFNTYSPSIEQMRAEVKRLVTLGATVVQERSRNTPARETPDDDVWTVMQDPDGNEFCIGVVRP